ncbi:O-antigen ligase family protein [Spirosoma montaniterrae]|uniref:O-antigen ligase family protein n=1 Tax=Spirosoma montaniterrae TaxID=1178516 RepID=UPI00097D9B52|nr:O-antigen ligase family protein [Spirosoma montaniterrae]
MFDRSITLTDQLRSNQWVSGLLVGLYAAATGWLIGNFGILGGLMAVGLPVGVFVLGSILVQPKIGLFIYLNLSFMLSMTRFLTIDFPMGTVLDGLLVLTLVSAFLNGKRMDWKRLKHPVFLLIIIWLAYTLLEYFNPDAPYRPAWFYHIRSFSLNWFLMAIVVLVLPISRRDIRWFVGIWLTWSFLGALWAFKQQYIGLTPSEQAWLASGAERTHVLWGQLRSFSFYSDAGQFGSEMAGVTLLCLIWFFEDRSLIRKVLFVFLAAIYFWGFAVSGTRSALFVLVGGYPVYLFMLRRVGPVLRGIAVAAPVLAILMFTHLGDSNYQIYRIRTALRPTQDASFLVRLENQQKLRNYMKDLPFGAGIGSSSGAGVRFSPNHFAAQIAPDSWYVQLWIETGIVGVSIYILMLIGIVLLGVRAIWQLNDNWLRIVMIALLAEFVGMALTSYSNPILGQFPTSTTLYITSILFTTCKRWDTEPEELARPASRYANQQRYAPVY